MQLLRKLLMGLCAVSLLCIGSHHATADEPDNELVNMAMKQLRELKKNPLPVFSRNAGKGVVKLEKGKRARWNEDAMVFSVIGWSSSSSINLNNGDVFVNVGPSVVKVGDSELKKGEYVLYKNRKLRKVTLKELGG